MKNFFGTLLILIFMLPAFAPWMPQGLLQSLHDQKEHHQVMNGGEFENAHHDAQADISHLAHFDITSYFSDYLHVDLRNQEAQKLSVPTHDILIIDYALAANLSPLPISRLSLLHITDPPKDDWRMSYQGMPVYLTTQRLRI